jgi:hypothetical protein
VVASDVAGAADAPVCVGVASVDTALSLFDGFELACAPPELCTTPERGSGVEASLGEEVEAAWPSTESCTIPDDEPDEEPAADADESVDDVGPVDDGLAADSDDEPEAEGEPDELESVESANASAGVFATAAPTPSATANAPARTMYCAFTDPALGEKPARAPGERPPAPP